MKTVYEQLEKNDLVIFFSAILKNENWHRDIEIKDDFSTVGINTREYDDNSFESDGSISFIRKENFIEELNKINYVDGYEAVLIPNFSGKINMKVWLNDEKDISDKIITNKMLMDQINYPTDDVSVELVIDNKFDIIEIDMDDIESVKKSLNIVGNTNFQTSYDEFVENENKQKNENNLDDLSDKYLNNLKITHKNDDIICLKDSEGDDVIRIEKGKIMLKMHIFEPFSKYFDNDYIKVQKFVSDYIKNKYL